MQVIQIKENVFKTDVLIIANCSLEECDKYLKKIKNKYTASDNNYLVIEGRLIQTSDDLYRIMYVKELNKKNLSTFAHELFHLVVRICENKGVPIIPNIQTGQCGDETAAYLFEFYFNEVYKKLK